MTKQEFQTKIDEFLVAEDEVAARKFILDNYLELPADMQENLAWAFLDDAAAYAERESRVLATIQEAAVDALEAE